MTPELAQCITAAKQAVSRYRFLTRLGRLWFTLLSVLLPIAALLVISDIRGPQAAAARRSSEPESLILNIPVKSVPKLLTAKLPSKIMLLAAPKQGQSAKFQITADLISIDDLKNGWITVQLSKPDADTVLQNLGLCDIYVAAGS